MMRFWQAYLIAAMSGMLSKHFESGPDGWRGALLSMILFVLFGLTWLLGKRLSPPAQLDQQEARK